MDRKSSEGYICKLYGGPVNWRAAKQKTVSTSTIEAELLAISEAGKRLFVWKRLFNAIEFDPEHMLSLKCDNRQTIRLLTREDPQFHTKLRHIDIQHHWLRQEIPAGRLQVEWISTKDMPADGLTKIFPRQKHEIFRICQYIPFVTGLGLQYCLILEGCVEMNQPYQSRLTNQNTLFNTTLVTNIQHILLNRI